MLTSRTWVLAYFLLVLTIILSKQLKLQVMNLYTNNLDTMIWREIFISNMNNIPTNLFVRDGTLKVGSTWVTVDLGVMKGWLKIDQTSRTCCWHYILRNYIDRLNMLSKEEGRGLTSIEDCIDVWKRSKKD